MSPNTLDTLGGLLWSQLWQVTLVAMVIGVAVRVFCKHRVHLAYLLWMLVIVKCLTPPVVVSPMALISWPSQLQSQTTPLPSRVAHETTAESSVASAVSSDLFDSEAAIDANSEPKAGLAQQLTISRALIACWLTGIGCLLAVLALKWLHFRRQLRRSAMIATSSLQQAFDRVKAKLGIRRQVRLLVTSLPTMPAVYGIVRPTIILPSDLVKRLTSDELEPILAHELLHVRRFDTIAGQLQLVTRVLWWFHPLVWWANREVGRVRERCCDQQVVASLGCRPAQYARCLLQVLSLRVNERPALAAIAIEPADLTANRLRSIMRPIYRHQSSTPLWCWLVSVVVASLVLPGASVSSPRPAGASDDFDYSSHVAQEGLDQSIADSEQDSLALANTQRQQDSGESDADKQKEEGPAGPSVRNVPPTVVKTFPVSGDKNVSPKTNRISVTFSKQMTDQSWSWVQISDETFPRLVGDIQYLKDGKTCVADVKLEPNRTYVIWFNDRRGKFQNFKDRARQSAVPYLLVFETGDADD